MCVCVVGGGGVHRYIYNPTKNPIKLEENRCSPNAYIHFTKITSNRQPGVYEYYGPTVELIMYNPIARPFC